MARVTIEDCLKNVDSRFSLMHLAVRRVLQLRGGAPRLVDAPKNKDIVVALREIAAGKVNMDNIPRIGQDKDLSDAASPEKQVTTTLEIQETFEAATRSIPGSEYDPKEQFIDQDQDEE